MDATLPKTPPLITFPQQDPEGKGWRNSGEGGLFVYALVRASKAHQPSACVVDAPLLIKDPNVCLTDDGGVYRQNTLWHKTGGHDEDFGMGSTSSEPLAACVLLATTWESLYHETWGDYFQATLEDLTEEGRRLVDALALIGEVELYTFLDT